MFDFYPAIILSIIAVILSAVCVVLSGIALISDIISDIKKPNRGHKAAYSIRQNEEEEDDETNKEDK